MQEETKKIFYKKPLAIIVVIYKFFKKLLRLLLVLIGFPILLLIIFFIFKYLYLNINSTGVFMSSEEKVFYNKLQEFENSEKSHIKLKDLTNFKWEIVCPRSYYRPNEDWFPSTISVHEAFIDFYYKKNTVIRIEDFDPRYRRYMWHQFSTLENSEKTTYYKYNSTDTHFKKQVNCFNNQVNIKIKKMKDITTIIFFY
jgi:hypothetical protein